MRKTYLLPEMTVLKGAHEDILTISYIYDESNRENIVVDPFSPRATAGDVALSHQDA